MGDVLAQGEIMDLRDVFNQVLKRRQFVLRHKDDDDFLQYCPVLTGKEETVLIVPVTDVAILHLVYASSEMADEPLANLLAGLSKKLSVAIEACAAHKNIIKEIQVRVEAEEELQKKTEQLISSEKELQRLYGESEQARKSLLSILEDVTQKENALRESEEKYRNIIENIQDIFYRTDMEGNLVMISSAGAKQLGYDSIDAMLGLNIAKTFYAVPEESDGFLKALGTTGVVNDYEITLKKKDGTLVPVRASSHIYFDKSGNPLGVEGLLSDLTERKRAEQRTLEKQKIIDSLIQNSAVATFAIDSEHKVIYWNKACEELTGILAQEIIGTDHHWKAFYDHKRPCAADIVVDGKFEEMACFYKKCSKSNLAPNGLHAEGWYPKLGGKERFITFDAAPIYDSEGKLIIAVETLQDITERKAAEEEIKKKTDELKGFNKLAVGRELKMIELKKEINALLWKLGEKPEYEIAGES